MEELLQVVLEDAALAAQCKMILPIDEIESEFLTLFDSLDNDAKIVLTAPTGSGKSTRVPLWCQQGGARVLVIEPRRVAARTLAEWVARARAESVGESVGYTIRFENRSSDKTDILFVTPGVARRFLTEGTIAEFDTIIFDEFHERSWESDALLALLAAREGRDAVRTVIMSATLMARTLAERYDARLIEAHSRSFPVTISYLEDEPGLIVPSARGVVERTIGEVKAAWSESDGNILVFLPGLASMREVASGLARLPVVLLHGGFSQKEQARAFSGEEKKIVLATNVAESSLTIPGVTTVIDSGLERRQVHRSGYVALATVSVAMSSADQRAGRAGRTSPGRCRRLWSQQARLEETRPPELMRMELDELVMFVVSTKGGLSSPAEWLDEPPKFAWERAVERLRTKQLINSDGHLTDLGRRCQVLPVDSQWARVIVAAPTELQAMICDLCALATARRRPLKETRSEEVALSRREDLGEDPWRVAVQLLNKGDATRHALDPEALESCRQVACELRSLCGVSGSLEGSYGALKEFLVKTWPERAFVLRNSRRGWANGQVECTLARGETLPEETIAVFFLDIQPRLKRGLKVELQAHWGLPIEPYLLYRSGLGQPRTSKLRWSDGYLYARVVRELAGRDLGGSEEKLEGSELRQALAELASRGEWAVDETEVLVEEQFYRILDAELEGRSVPSLDAKELMRARLEELGVSECGDLGLLEIVDYSSNDLPVERVEQLRRDYPRLYRIAGHAFDMVYEPRQARVVMRSLSSKKGVKLNPQHLPRWNGWRVELDERGRRTLLRS